MDSNAHTFFFSKIPRLLIVVHTHARANTPAMSLSDTEAGKLCDELSDAEAGKLCDEGGCKIIVREDGDEGQMCDRCEETFCYHHLDPADPSWTTLESEYDLDDGMYCRECLDLMQRKDEELAIKDEGARQWKSIQFSFERHVNKTQTTPPPKEPPAAPICPSCKQTATFGVTRKGKNAGREYYVCRKHGCEKPLFKWKSTRV